MFKIYKYILNKTVTLIPKGSTILSIQVQKERVKDSSEETVDRLCLWALVNTTEIETEEILTYGTGEEVKGYVIHKGTYQLFGGELVFHVFTRKS